MSAQNHAECAFASAQRSWKEALEAHRLAPPDAGFSERLGALAAAASQEVAACREAGAAGYEWPPHRAVLSEPPYELRRDSGRSGPHELWRRFDAAATDLSRAAAGTDILAVADAYAQLSEAAGALAEAVERADQASGPAQRTRARRSV
jgi:hypothetical protein